MKNEVAIINETLHSWKDFLRLVFVDDWGCFNFHFLVPAEIEVPFDADRWKVHFQRVSWHRDCVPLRLHNLPVAHRVNEPCEWEFVMNEATSRAFRAYLRKNNIDFPCYGKHSQQGY